MNLKELTERVWNGSEDNGWHDRFAHIKAYDDGEALYEHIVTKLALVTTEVAEGIEEVRNGHDFDVVYHGEDGKPEGLPIELADVIIRVLDIAAMLYIDIEGAIEEKLDYNKSRGYRHGGKTL